MKKLLITSLFLLILNTVISAEYFIGEKFKLITYSNMETNYIYKTNYFPAYYGWGDETNGVRLFERRGNLTGVVTSNNICKIYYDEKYMQAITNSVILGEINIISKTNIIYITNYFEYKFSRHGRSIAE